jgi:hypothetical protein
MKTSVLLAFVCAVFMALFSVPANAQATRTWISGVGDDANPCSRTAPCKTFAGAISKTASPGEINCLDPGGFGAVTITKAISIICDPMSNGGVLVAGTPGITVAASAGQVVYLEGLDFEGVASGTNGVQVSSGGTVYIVRCTIRDFTGNGVNVTSTTAGQRVFIKDSFIENNAGGVNVQGNGVSNVADIVNTVVDGNTSFAVQAATGNTIALVNTVLTGSPAGISNLGTASIISFGPSNVIGGSGAPTSSPTFK